MKLEITPERDSFNTCAEPMVIYGNEKSIQFNIDDRELVFNIEKLQKVLDFLRAFHQGAED